MFVFLFIFLYIIILYILYIYILTWQKKEILKRERCLTMNFRFIILSWCFIRSQSTMLNKTTIYSTVLRPFCLYTTLRLASSIKSLSSLNEVSSLNHWREISSQSFRKNKSFYCTQMSATSCGTNYISPSVDRNTDFFNFSRRPPSPTIILSKATKKKKKDVYNFSRRLQSPIIFRDQQQMSITSVGAYNLPSSFETNNRCL